MKRSKSSRSLVRRLLGMDEPEILCETAELFQLLRHYAELGSGDRESWQDRLMSLDGVAPHELSRLHGELIAQGWIEQNTGATAVVKPGIAAACYRVTSAGLKTYRQLNEPQA
jgi:hypothetical protein